MNIEDLEDFYEEYIWLIENNIGLFQKEIFNILDWNNKNINEEFWLNNWIKQLINITISNNKMNIEKIIARWHWKEIMFLILKYAIENDINELTLKAYPLYLKENENFNDRQKFLFDFYWYFWFKKDDLNWNMNLNFEDFNIQSLQIIYNRLAQYINNK